MELYTEIEGLIKFDTIHPDGDMNVILILRAIHPKASLFFIYIW